MRNDDIVIFQMRMADQLIKKGYKIVGVDRNTKTEGIVFYFKRTDKLIKELRENFNIKI